MSVLCSTGGERVGLHGFICLRMGEGYPVMVFIEVDSPITEVDKQEAARILNF